MRRAHPTRPFPVKGEPCIPCHPLMSPLTSDIVPLMALDFLHVAFTCCQWPFASCLHGGGSHSVLCGMHIPHGALIMASCIPCACSDLPLPVYGRAASHTGKLRDMQRRCFNYHIQWREHRHRLRHLLQHPKGCLVWQPDPTVRGVPLPLSWGIQFDIPEYVWHQYWLAGQRLGHR